MKRLISLCIALMMIIGMTYFPVEVTAATVKTDISQIDMEKYFAITAKGTIEYDLDGARDDGIDEDIILFVNTQICRMNELVLAGHAYINDNYEAVMYGVMNRAAVGENKVVTTWYGLTQLYMDSDKADALYNELSALSENLINSVNDSMYNAILENSGVNVLHIAALGLSGYFGLYAWQVEQAKEPGRGIIMNVQNDYTNQTQSIWYTSQ